MDRDDMWKEGRREFRGLRRDERQLFTARCIVVPSLHRCTLQRLGREKVLWKVLLALTRDEETLSRRQRSKRRNRLNTDLLVISVVEHEIEVIVVQGVFRVAEIHRVLALRGLVKHARVEEWERFNATRIAEPAVMFGEFLFSEVTREYFVKRRQALGVKR